MTTKVEKSISVDVPVSVAYNQWTQFEEFPEFMGGVSEVRQLDDQRLHWVAQIAGVKREWDARIVEQVPDERVTWAATEGATNAGGVYFTSTGPSSTMVRLELEYEPEGVVEQVGDRLNIVSKQAESDLEKFKSFIESRGSESGGWRGGVDSATSTGTPGVEDAAGSRGDSGKAGVSGKAVATGIAAVAAAAGVAAAVAHKGSDDDSEDTATTVPATPAPTDVPTTYPASDTTYPASDTTYPASSTTSDVASDLPVEQGTSSTYVAGDVTEVTGTPTTAGTGLDDDDLDTPRRPV